MVQAETGFPGAQSVVTEQAIPMRKVQMPARLLMRFANP